jgi:hypothetical protein
MFSVATNRPFNNDALAIKRWPAAGMSLYQPTSVPKVKGVLDDVKMLDAKTNTALVTAVVVGLYS